MRFAIEHLPRAAATYRVSPVTFDEARVWLAHAGLASVIRTTELIRAIAASFGTNLEQADQHVVLRPGDEALLISVSFSVLMAFTQGNIPPLPEDWRCLLLRVGTEEAEVAPSLLTMSQDLTGEPTA